MRVRFAVAVMSLAFSVGAQRVAAQKEMHVVHANGSFDVKMTPAEPTEFEKANDIARLTSDTVSYTHLDVYKRQILRSPSFCDARNSISAHPFLPNIRIR